MSRLLQYLNLVSNSGMISLRLCTSLHKVIEDRTIQSISLADIDISDSIIASKNIVIACPYCGSKFDNKNDLSKHIDRIHIGAGLLEGDTRQW